ncbi:MAG: bifunctional DNA primase/polymerase, partial [Deltaproteobacteria bacterium]|nr:bifunctional DNA primase/polymerase [Deltaproteobacteria bacterium]
MICTIELILSYAAKGWPTIPIEPRGKKPLIPWADFQQRVPTTEEVQAWFEKWPDANIGIVTGKISQLIVVDVDSEQAQATIDKLLPDSLVTPVAKTAKGKHYYFVRPPGGLQNRVRVDGVALDVRCDSGYVVAPPSVHKSGLAYEWIVSPNDAALAELPQSIIDLIEKDSKAQLVATPALSVMST